MKCFCKFLEGITNAIGGQCVWYRVFFRQESNCVTSLYAGHFWSVEGSVTVVVHGRANESCRDTMIAKGGSFFWTCLHECQGTQWCKRHLTIYQQLGSTPEVLNLFGIAPAYLVSLWTVVEPLSRGTVGIHSCSYIVEMR